MRHLGSTPFSLAPRYGAVLVLLLLSTLACQSSVEIPDQAIQLRDTGFAELENERPEKAEEAYRQLLEIYPDDPLGHANLAIALLRQQKYDDARGAIDRALELEPERGELMAIEAEILQWQGDLEGALAGMRRAMDAAPDDLEILYAAYQLATTAEGDLASATAYAALERLAELRPENAVVILQLGQQAIAEGDRTTATGAYQRIGELLWQVQPMAQRALDMVDEALRQDDVTAARVPAVRLENVLKISPLYRESLRELKTGIQGVPIRTFRGESPPTAFGAPLDIRFVAAPLSATPTVGGAVTVGDFDGDLRTDIARLVATDPAPRLEIRLAADDHAPSAETSPAADAELEDAEQAATAPSPAGDTTAAAEARRLLATDLDNDGNLDLLAVGPAGGVVWLGRGDGTFLVADRQMGLADAQAMAAAVIDFDIEGDLDVVTVGGPAAVDLHRNSLEGPLEAVGAQSLPSLDLAAASGVAVSDLDRDGDLDLAVAHGQGIQRLDNLRQGRFVAAPSVHGSRGPLGDLVAADFDQDGYPDLVAVGQGFQAWRNGGADPEAPRGTAVEMAPWSPPGLESAAELNSLIAFDGDNDGRLDVAAVGAQGPEIRLRGADGGFRAAAVDNPPANLQGIASADLDDDGDLDLVVAGGDGLYRLTNEGGNENQWLTVRLRGLNKGNSKNNMLGVGSVVEVRSGQAYQYHEAAGDVLHLGLGEQSAAEVLRVVWTNGVPQNRLQLAGRQQIVEEQLLKGSCPFLYAWNGEEFVFVTDLLWGAPLGLPVAPGAWASSDPSELVRIDGLQAENDIYRLRVTEELWEAAFFDHVRLWVVDHPQDVEVASNLRIVPGASPQPERVLASRQLRPLAAAWDGQGRDVTTAVSRRDEVYADGYRKSRYQGVAAEPWTFTFDLGEAPNRAVRLHMDGWIFPADASLNLAVAQRTDLPNLPPRLEMETDDGWQVLMPSTGFPAGKTKTLVLDVPPLPEGVHKLRLVSNLWLHWDRVAWTLQPVDDLPVVRGKLLASHADLRFRGYSAEVRQAPNAPHSFDYGRTRTEPRWVSFAGNYTRFGDVLPLLEQPDDFSVILAPGDEIDLRFDGSSLPAVEDGWRRTLFLESHGWDKDADRNTHEAQQVEPLPFRAMSGYPYAEGESFPDTPEHRSYREQWLTREIGRERGTR